jgi:hypothetical protein
MIRGYTVSISPIDGVGILRLADDGDGAIWRGVPSDMASRKNIARALLADLEPGMDFDLLNTLATLFAERFLFTLSSDQPCVLPLSAAVIREWIEKQINVLTTATLR